MSVVLNVVLYIHVSILFDAPCNTALFIYSSVRTVYKLSQMGVDVALAMDVTVTDTFLHLHLQMYAISLYTCIEPCKYCLHELSYRG